MSFSRQSHPVCAIRLWQPQQANTAFAVTVPQFTSKQTVATITVQQTLVECLHCAGPP